MKNLSVFEMTTCAIMAALMCIFGPMSIPIGPIPISLTVLVLFVSLMLIGTKFTFISYLVYILLGAAGLPVFSGYQGGPAKLVGPTGGYLVGFFFMILIGGYFVRRFRDKPVIIIAGFFLAVVAAYIFGTAWFVLMMKCDIWYALTVCVFPFIPFDLVKIIIAVVLGSAVYKPLCRAGLAGTHAE